jgi:hypothetical protein
MKTLFLIMFFSLDTVFFCELPLCLIIPLSMYKLGISSNKLRGRSFCLTLMCLVEHGDSAYPMSRSSLRCITHAFLASPLAGVGPTMGHYACAELRHVAHVNLMTCLSLVLDYVIDLSSFFSPVRI